MAKYRKKPVVVEAFQFNKETHISDVHDFLNDVHEDCDIFYDTNMKRFYVQTLEGRMDITYGDYIIKGVKKEIYPCKSDIFEATYEKVEE
jgi:hypothetical protein